MTATLLHPHTPGFALVIGPLAVATLREDLRHAADRHADTDAAAESTNQQVEPPGGVAVHGQQITERPSLASSEDLRRRDPRKGAL